jgi:hypothetical protein
MKVILTNEESENIFFNALCNGRGVNPSLFIDCNEEEYKLGKKHFQDTNQSCCLEDVWMQVLRNGGTLTLVDTEHCEEPSTITLQDVHAKVQDSPIEHLMDAINENDDAITADVILQSVFYGEVIFG